ncbi:MAG TPA: hypothetical protein VD997_12535 [Phycisphaerales bacterium]|nr:hypothetical protein [Phycisphaerales bacterium]
MRWMLRSWRVWVAVAFVVIPLLTAVLCEYSAGRVLLAKWGLVSSIAPRGRVWFFWGTGEIQDSKLQIYDAWTTSIIVTHHEDGTATVQQVFNGTGPRSSRWHRPVAYITKPTDPWASLTPADIQQIVSPRPPTFGGGLSISFSMAWVCVASLVPSAWLFRSAWRKRPRSGCRACGYSRTGLSNGAACPECGAGAAATA